jgi:5-methylcytosine-specific restriction endonuclease McrA
VLRDKTKPKLNRQGRSIGAIPWETRCYIYSLYDGKCGVCRTKMPFALGIHHIVKKSQGGTNERENLKLECERCHGGEHGERIT